MERLTFGFTATHVDTSYVVIAFDGPDLTRAFIVRLPVTGPFASAALLDDTVAYMTGPELIGHNFSFYALTGTGNAALVGTSASCSSGEVTCRTAAFTVTLNATMVLVPSDTSIEPTERITASTQIVAGVVADSTTIH